MSTSSFRAGLNAATDRWPIAALVVVFALLFLQFLLKVQTADHNRSAFLRWRPQLEELDDGVNVWQKYSYPNPPIMAILLKPFLALPPGLGSLMWFGCKALFALASILGLCTLLDSTERPFPLWAKAVATLLTLKPIEGDLLHGNVNLLILFLIVATLIAFCHRRDGLAGLLLGLSIACKLTPALFLLYFLHKRAWKTLFGAMAGLLAFVIVIPALGYGWTNSLDYLRSWHEQMIAPYAAGQVTPDHKNQSLPGLLYRMVGDEAPDRVKWIVVGCMAFFALGAMRFCRTSLIDRPRLQLLAEFSVVALGMLLFCERTWKHHCVTLLLPFCGIAYCLADSAISRGVKWYLGVTLTLVGILMLSTSSGVFDHDTSTHDRIGKLCQVYGAYTWAFLLLLASMFVILRKTNVSAFEELACPPTSKSRR